MLCCSTEPAASWGDIPVNSAHRGGNTATRRASRVVTRHFPLDRLGGKKTVAPRPSPQQVGVTLLSLQPTWVSTQPLLRASRVVTKRSPLDKLSGTKTVDPRPCPQLVGVTLLSLQPTWVATQPPACESVVTKWLSLDYPAPGHGQGEITVTSGNRVTTRPPLHATDCW